MATAREGWRLEHDDIHVDYECLLGRGGFGDVYLGTYMSSDVAVKVAHLPVAASDPGALDGFVGEGALMTKLHHPNIVMIMGVAVHESMDGAHVVEIVTELMSKGSLRNIISADQWETSTRFLLRVVVDAARGLAYLHGRKPAIVHCDVKSPNLLVTDDWRGKIGGASCKRQGMIGRGRDCTSQWSMVSTPRRLPPIAQTSVCPRLRSPGARESSASTRRLSPTCPRSGRHPRRCWVRNRHAPRTYFRWPPWCGSASAASFPWQTWVRDGKFMEG